MNANANRRILRDAALDSACETYGPFEIVAEIRLEKTEPKFSAWITGARGRNGFKVADPNGNTYVVGLTTLIDFHERGSVLNWEGYASVLRVPAAAGIPTIVAADSV